MLRTPQDRPTFAAPLEEVVPLRGGEITVRSADVGALLKVKARLLPALELLASEAPGIFDLGRLDLLVQSRQVTAQDITDLCVLLERADVAVEFVAILAALEPARVLALMPDEFAYLFVTVVQVNADFFAQALPVFKAAVQRVRGLPRSGTSSSPLPSTA
jgi:hypothetical protein